MADIFDKEKRSSVMRAVKSKDTKLELRFRKDLWRTGVRYRKNPSRYFGKPDLAIKKYQLVIFIDSCFWHGCETHCRMPSTQIDFWERKINRNINRDKEVLDWYKKQNWTILRFWEHDLKKNHSDCVDQVCRVVKKGSV